MMTDIVWIFYLVNLVYNFKLLTIFAVIVSIVLFVVFLIGVATSPYMEEKNRLLIWLKFSIITFFISSLLFCIIPSRATVYMAASDKSVVCEDVMDIAKIKIKEFKKELVKNED